MANKLKDPNRLGFKTYLGTTLMGMADGMQAALMTSWFMVYLTDYAGIGKWGAIMGTTVLFAARLFDAVNDPLEGWIMDRAKVGKYGKYRPFIFLSILLTTIGVGGLFFIPQGLAGSPVTLGIWILGFYLLLDIGVSFFAPNLIYRTLTLDSNQRSKLLIAPRLLSMSLGIITAGLIGIVNGVNANFGNMHTAFGVTVLVLIGSMALVSLLGTSLIKEKYHAPTSEDAEKIKLSDIFTLLKENKALQVRVSSMAFDGFIWTFLFATALYYIKWAYCADLATGAVDSGRYGILALVSSMMMFLPLIVGTVIAAPIMKKFGSPIKFNRFLTLVMSVSCGALFLLQITGLLKFSPVLFFIPMAITAIAIGAGYIPGETINIECMDYEIYKNGKDRSALCNACNKFLGKAQSAISTGMIGVLLTAIGYTVDSATDTYIGDLARIPSMLTWFIVIMGLVPCVLGLISWVIQKNYPITNEVRDDMAKVLSK